MEEKKGRRLASDRQRGIYAVAALAILKRFHAGKLTHLAREKQKLPGEKIGGQKIAFRVLIGTILSHRTKDERTEKATHGLLERYPTPQELADAPLGEIRRLIRPVGFYNSKAQYVKKCCGELVERFGGKVPSTMEELTSLTGVGRKTAGCVVAYAFEKPAIPIDSHCHRVSNRLGLVATKTPEETEIELMKILPEGHWREVNELLVLHGQNTCVPVSPFCSKCPLQVSCPKIGVNARR